MTSFRIGLLLSFSGSSDQTCSLVDMKYGKDLGILHQLDGNGAVETLCFHEDYLFVASHDGNIRICDVKNEFEVLKSLESGSETGFAGLATHPSGKFAIVCAGYSRAAGSKLQFWNLMDGSRIREEDSEVEIVDISFSRSGDQYFIAHLREVLAVDVSSMESKSIVSFAPTDPPITSMCVYKDSVLIGQRSGLITIVSQKSGKCKSCLKHSARVKAMLSVDQKDCFVSIDTSGVIFVWKEVDGNLSVVADYDLARRLTCLTLVD